MIDFVARSLTFSVVLAAAVTAEARQSGVSSDDYSRAEAVLTSFDRAWGASDLDGIMAPISPQFGCELYGEVDAGMLRNTFATLFDMLPRSQCRTQVLGVADDGRHIQAYVCRKFTSDDSLVEELCHLVYLKKESGKLRIIGLEEFDHEGYECVQSGRYSNPRLALSFHVPAGTFFVPRPKNGYFLERVLLRGHGLESSIEIMLLPTNDPIDLDAALTRDLGQWLSENAPAKLQRREPSSVAHHPAVRADARYSGMQCALSGRDQKMVQMELTRIYAQLDASVLLAIDLNAPRSLHAEAAAMLASVLESIEVSPPEGHTYGEWLAGQFGWGPITSGKFESDVSGFSVHAPPGFALERTHSPALFTLRARSPSGNSVILIDAVERIDPETSLDELIAVDEAAIPAKRERERHCTVGGQSAIQVDRRIEAPPSRFESVVYVGYGNYVFTIRTSGSADAIDAARADLERLLRNVSLRHE